ncbi:hypothetical protein [Duncaniella muris]|uniref:hypothetical protein n=1 Tax=Duncaniella muris TaxID=2094150 RepID=UPI003F67A576
MEVIRPMDHIHSRRRLHGFEKSHTGIGVASGLGIGAPAGHPFYKKIIDSTPLSPISTARADPCRAQSWAHVTASSLKQDSGKKTASRP